MVIATILRYEWDQDRYGGEVRRVDGYSPARIDVPGCMFAPGRSADLIGPGRDGAQVSGTLYLPAGTDLDHRDQFEVLGDVYDIDGAPEVWDNGFTTVGAGVVVVLRRAVG